MSRKTKTFSITHTTDEGENLQGTFTTQRLSILDRSKMGARRSQLGGGFTCVKDDNGNPTGQGIDEDTDYLNLMVAHMEICLIQKPTWFKLQEMTDLDLMKKVYEEVGTFEGSFRGKSEVPGNGDSGSGEAQSSGQPTGKNDRGDAPKVVDKKVSASLDA